MAVSAEHEQDQLSSLWLQMAVSGYARLALAGPLPARLITAVVLELLSSKLGSDVAT